MTSLNRLYIQFIYNPKLEKGLITQNQNFGIITTYPIYFNKKRVFSIILGVCSYSYRWSTVRASTHWHARNIPIYFSGMIRKMTFRAWMA